MTSSLLPHAYRPLQAKFPALTQWPGDPSAASVTVQKNPQSNESMYVLKSWVNVCGDWSDAEKSRAINEQACPKVMAFRKDNLLTNNTRSLTDYFWYIWNATKLIAAQKQLLSNCLITETYHVIEKSATYSYSMVWFGCHYELVWQAARTPRKWSRRGCDNSSCIIHLNETHLLVISLWVSRRRFAEPQGGREQEYMD